MSSHPATEVRHLLVQLNWFHRLRFGAVVGVVLFTVLAAHVFGVHPGPLPLYLLAGVTLSLNLIYLARMRSLASLSVAAVRRHVDLEIGLDLLVLIALVHFSGGIANPFVLFYLFHTFIAAMLLSARAGVTVASVSWLLVASLGVLELQGLFSPRSGGLRLIDLQQVGALGLASWLLAFGLTLGTSVYFVATILAQVRSRDEELRRLSERLGQSEKLASIGTLAAGVAHEINNPVGVIRNKAQILRHRINDGDAAPALLTELDTIEKHTQRIGSITSGLLTFSKVTPFVLRPLDLNQLAEEGKTLVRVPYKGAEVELELLHSPRPLMVSGSANHLLQVLVNLLLNAKDASAVGGKVRVSLASAGGQASLEIQDWGEGIAAEALPKIFDPFFTTKDVDKGTGLGLAISHGIVSEHGGEIRVQSVVGEGSTFQLLLPLARAVANQ